MAFVFKFADLIHVDEERIVEGMNANVLESLNCRICMEFCS
jgi:hypothetical protein